MVASALKFLCIERYFETIRKENAEFYIAIRLKTDIPREIWHRVLPWEQQHKMGQT